MVSTVEIDDAVLVNGRGDINGKDENEEKGKVPGDEDDHRDTDMLGFPTTVFVQ